MLSKFIKDNYPEVVQKSIENTLIVEKRTKKKLNGQVISGKFDVCLDGQVMDLKTTSVYTDIFSSNKEAYILQLSIYKWLNPELITNDIGIILYYFTDWKARDAEYNENYPEYKVKSIEVPLMSLKDTELWLTNKLNNIAKYKNCSQEDMPRCSLEELWQELPKYAYFKNPDGKRATKVFKDFREANDRLLKDGSVGKVETRLGKPKRCDYCSAKPICSQAQEYVSIGLLEP